MIYMFYMVNKPSQFMSDQLADEIAVRLACGKRTMPRIIVEKLVGVREVEVPGEEKRVR